MYAAGQPPRPDSVAGKVLAAPRLLRARIEANIEEHGLVYPWWIPGLSMIGVTGITVASLFLREELWPPLTLAALLTLVMLPGVLQLIFGRHFPHVIETLAIFKPIQKRAPARQELLALDDQRRHKSLAREQLEREARRRAPKAQIGADINTGSSVVGWWQTS